ncbi:MAG TPA: GNAT family N-acetyltransferase [Casimicrobiaceae bacterium]|nr:GNAT family N-acetyltransferase [Casimicrobiaceae bacterium]
MGSVALETLLDRPVWSCLTTHHAHFARGDGLARRYDESISPIGAIAGGTPAHVTALEALVGAGHDVALIGPAAPELPGNWRTLYASRLIQMIRADRSPLPEGELEALALGAADVPEILELVELTKPGPFRLRTIELGRYLGVRERGRLVAMAGERMWIGEAREVSAVCTHPDVQRRGYARALVGRVVNRMLRSGETPMLHVDHPNRRAIEMYRALGFVPRAELALLHAMRIT